MNRVEVIFKNKYYKALNSPDRKNVPNENFIEIKIGSMFDYFSNAEKRAMNLFDYYTGKINKNEKVNLVLENGNYATEEEIERRKKDYKKYIKYSNLYLGILSFNNDYIDESIELQELEQKIVKEAIPKFLRYCGFKDIKKMSYQVALHTNTDNYHFHIAFIEKEPNYITSSGKVAYRRKGTFTKKERNFFRSEVMHLIERHKYFTPLVKNTNQEIDKLKTYFKPTERNFVLRNKKDLILEENIIKLGYLIYTKRECENSKIKFNSIYDKEIKDLTKSIKKYLFKDKNSLLYKQDKIIKDSLNDINKYFERIHKANNIKTTFKSDYVKEKEKYIDNYVYNAIVNYSLNKYKYLSKNNFKGLTEEELLQEIILKNYKKTKSRRKLDILENYLSSKNNKSQFVNKRQIEKSIKKINAEMEEAITEFSRLFVEQKNRSDEL